MRYGILLLILLSGCASMEADRKFTEANKYCFSSVPKYEYGKCLEDNLNANYPDWKKQDDAYLAQSFINWNKAAGNVLKEGKMTEAEYELKRIEIYQQLQMQAKQDKAERSASLAQAFYGLSLMANQGQYNSQIQTTTYNFSGQRPITCNTVGNVVNCF